MSMSVNFNAHEHLDKIASLYRADENVCLQELFSAAQLDSARRYDALSRATRWIKDIRHNHQASVGVLDLLSRFGLTSQEGLALMCLAEALLRIPDRATADALIRDKLSEPHWNEALGHSTSWAINVTGWALALTGKIIQLDDPTHHSPGVVLAKLISRLGQPIIREAIKTSMQWLADQFVMGETITSALERAKPFMREGVRYSFDMLGEGARTSKDAERFYHDYAEAIEAVGRFHADHRFPHASGVSVKLSALHPRYEMTHHKRVLQELTPRLADLCHRAMRHNIPLTIDAEEADRLQLSLDCLTTLLATNNFGSWNKLGFVVQAYQKRAPAVIDYLTSLARAHQRKIVVRLVKGAYWDTEIKRAQERGWDDFPVYTRKAGTEVSYLACAKQILAAADVINPLFGTHNAMTVAHLIALAGDNTSIEFQHLHGMGDDLYGLMQKEGFKCGVYAPVGRHDVLLGYLVRRILENGANSSFVHRVVDERISIETLTADPVDELKSYSTMRHPAVCRAQDLFAPERKNSAGLDLSDPFVTTSLLTDIEKYRWAKYAEACCVGGVYDHSVPNDASVARAFAVASDGHKTWSNESVETRALCLDKLAALLENNRSELMALLIREGGKTVPDALGEVREAVDFCRYYAANARKNLQSTDLPGPTGEHNYLRWRGRGVFICISPWNFPLAIFLGQITAALVSGNSVIAKPAPQTPLIATRVTQLIFQAGIPKTAFCLLLGGADIGAKIIQHPLVAGVAFTGSTATARLINQILANKSGPLVPLIAETGGQNALIVDSSALQEQVVDDVITSAFRSAGQRCSALRILCLPEPTADDILALLKGAMAELRVGDPGRLDIDVGPVIDKPAQQRLLDHIKKLKNDAKEIFVLPLPAVCLQGTFIAPQVWEIPSISWLPGEVFGPILHVMRYKPDTLNELIAQINATGFGLTGGVHSRIASTVRQVERDLHVGNFYVNRSIVGSIVGSQPFGGEGLSGTGPKAGGQHYLHRFVIERVTSNNMTAAGGNASLLMDASDSPMS
jgi:RHH-type transcriptional regulator, proline utilization regulon repressor / proline dehydrogenase / delta 1-pyrroline-5-carboxylate dehydrogenase